MKKAAVLFSTVLTLAVALPARAQTDPAAAMDGRWHFAVVPYFWFSGMEGSLSMRGLPEVPVEKPFSDIWSDLDFGFQGDFEARRDRWGFGTDIVYMNLGASVGEGRPILGELGLEADVRQLVVEGVAFRRVASGGKPENPAYLDVLAGARYFGASARLRGSRFDSTKRTLDWVDALGGVRFHVPLGSRLGLSARGVRGRPRLGRDLERARGPRLPPVAAMGHGCRVAVDQGRLRQGRGRRSQALRHDVQRPARVRRLHVVRG